MAAVQRLAGLFLGFFLLSGCAGGGAISRADGSIVQRQVAVTETVTINEQLDPFDLFYGDPFGLRLASLLHRLVDEAIEDARRGVYDPPAKRQRGTILEAAGCLSLHRAAVVEEDAGPGPSERLDRFFYRVLGNPDRHAAYVTFAQQSSLQAFRILPIEQQLNKCRNDFGDDFARPFPRPPEEPELEWPEDDDLEHPWPEPAPEPEPTRTPDPRPDCPEGCEVYRCDDPRCERDRECIERCYGRRRRMDDVGGRSEVEQ